MRQIASNRYWSMAKITFIDGNWQEYYHQAINKLYHSAMSPVIFWWSMSCCSSVQISMRANVFYSKVILLRIAKRFIARRHRFVVRAALDNRIQIKINQQRKPACVPEYAAEVKLLWTQWCMRMSKHMNQYVKFFLKFS